MPPSKPRSRTTKENSNGSQAATKGGLKKLRDEFKMGLADLRSDFSKQLEKIDRRFDDVSQEFVSLTTYIDKKSAETIEASKREMGVLFEELIHRLEVSLEFATALPPKIENHEERILKIEEEIPILQSVIAGRE